MYKYYENTIGEALDTIKAGDLVRVNDWTCPIPVKAASKNFFVMACKREKDAYCSVCSELPWNDVHHDAVVGSIFHCGCDNRVFGTPLGIRYENIYQSSDPELNRLYLQEFEGGRTHTPERNGVAIYDLYVEHYDD